MRAVRRAFSARVPKFAAIAGVGAFCTVGAAAMACAVTARGDHEPETPPTAGATAAAEFTVKVGTTEQTPTSPRGAPSVAAPSPPPPIADAPPAEADTPAPIAATPTVAPQEPSPPVLRDNQIIVYYGTPLADGLGILGTMPPAEAAAEVAERARLYDSLNGDIGAIGALDVIYSLAQAEPTSNGMYIRHLEDHYVDEYLRVAEEHDLQVFLDLQIGRRQILEEVRGIEKFLLNPRVHVAIDPEYAVGPEGVPIATPGRITGDQINDVQAYLRELVATHGLPGKVLVLHQYMEDTVIDAERVETVPEVDFVLNMDGLGDVGDKKEKYEHFSSKPHSKNDAFNIFLLHDHRVLSEDEILGLSPVPRIVFYQ
jgi:hypothetical protein